MLHFERHGSAVNVPSRNSVLFGTIYTVESVSEKLLDNTAG